jgi:hypothetical protein
MRVTIVPAENKVNIDGVAKFGIDCSGLPSDVSVIQWGGSSGWVEFVNDGHGEFVPNAMIADFAPYQYLVEAWGTAG